MIHVLTNWGLNKMRTESNDQPISFYGYYRQTSDISGSLVGNKLADHSDEVGVSAILDLKSGFNGLGKDDCKTRHIQVLRLCVLY